MTCHTVILGYSVLSLCSLLRKSSPLGILRFLASQPGPTLTSATLPAWHSGLGHSSHLLWLLPAHKGCRAQLSFHWPQLPFSLPLLTTLQSSHVLSPTPPQTLQRPHLTSAALILRASNHHPGQGHLSAEEKSCCHDPGTPRAHVRPLPTTYLIFTTYEVSALLLPLKTLQIRELTERDEAPHSSHTSSDPTCPASRSSPSKAPRL